MSKKYLFLITLFVVLSLSGLWLSLKYVSIQDELNMRGRHTFANTLQNMDNLEAIRISSPKGKHLNLYYEDGVWKMKEAAGYFVSTQTLKKFYNLLNESIIISVFPNASPAQKGMISYKQTENIANAQGIEIETFGKGGKILDDVIIGNPAEKKKEHYAKYFSGKVVYTISTAEGLSANPMVWLPYPLLRVDYILVEGLTIDDKTKEGNDLDNALLVSKKLQNAFYQLNDLSFDDIIRADDFFGVYPQLKAKEIAIFMRAGLIFKLKVFFVENNYFLQIEADTDAVARKKAAEFVSAQRKFYDGWIFMLNDMQGEVLYNLRF